MNTPNKKWIMVGIDFTEMSMKALRQSYSISRNLSAHLVLVHVHDPKEKSVHEVEAKMKALSENAQRKTKLEVESHILKGKAHEQILTLADEYNPKFIILGVNSQEVQNPKKREIGSTTARIIKKSSHPVLCVNDKIACHNFRTLLVPLDLSLETRQKVNQAVELASKFKSQVQLLSFVPEDLTHTDKVKMKIQSNQVKGFIQKAGVEVKDELINVENDKLSDNVLKYTASISETDLILIMTDYEHSIFDIFANASYKKLLQQSNVPVLSVKAQSIGKELKVISF